MKRRVVNSVALNRPKCDYRHVIDTRRDTKKTDRRKGSRSPLDQLPREQGVFRNVDLVKDEDDHEREARRQRRDHRNRMPRVVIASPVDPDKEDGQAGDAQKRADEIDPLSDLPLGQSAYVGPWRRVVKGGQQGKRDDGHQAEDQRDPAPAARRQELAVHGRRREGEEAAGDVRKREPAFVGRDQFGDGGNRSEELDPNGDSPDDLGDDSVCDVWGRSEDDH